MSTPAISIIIPVYNVAQYIGTCLESVKRQSFTDWEALVVNDASPDNSCEIVEAFIAENSELNIRLINLERNGGLSHARNVALEQASGRYVCFVDGDDDIPVDSLQRLYECAEAHNAEVAVGENLIINKDGNRYMASKVQKTVLEGHEPLESYCMRRWYNTAWGKIIKRSFIENNGLRFLEGYKLEDEVWTFQIAALARRVCFVKEIVYNYYIREVSIMSNFGKKAERWRTFLNVNAIIHRDAEMMNVADNPYVGKFMLENALVVAEGLKSTVGLTSNDIRRLSALLTVPLSRLHREGLLPIKQLIAYKYLELPSFFARPYCKLIEFLLKIKG